MSLVGPRPVPPVRDRALRAAPLRALPRPGRASPASGRSRRARTSTFGEALDMDVAYARSWSLGLDLRLLLRTPLQHPRDGEDSVTRPIPARARSAGRASSASATGGRTSSATCTSSPKPSCVAVCDLARGAARTRSRRRYPAVADDDALRGRPRRPDDRRGRDRDARLDALRARGRRPARRQARLRREAARGLVGRGDRADRARRASAASC